MERQNYSRVEFGVFYERNTYSFILTPFQTFFIALRDLIRTIRGEFETF